jgi:hypothetical protein
MSSFTWSFQRPFVFGSLSKLIVITFGRICVSASWWAASQGSLVAKLSAFGQTRPPSAPLASGVAGGSITGSLPASLPSTVMGGGASRLIPQAPAEARPPRHANNPRTRFMTRTP